MISIFIICFLVAFVISVVLTPLVRKFALMFRILDVPYTDIKTHKTPTPYLGGIAIASAFWVSIVVIRLFTSFPTGTLRSLRGILLGSFVMLLLGIFDDIKHKGLHFKFKFLVQAIAAVLLLSYGIRIKFIQPEWFAIVMTVIWVIGITNAFNIIDIMDGLSGGIALVCALGFFLIGIPAEEEIYVNFVSIALVGACLGFLPYNLGNKLKIVMGDTGALFIGFILASVSLGVKYTEVNTLGLFAPLLILAIPMYDTLLVIYFRWKKGKSPFLGSKDHFALRLEKIGYSRKKIIVVCYIVSLFLSFCALLITRVDILIAGVIYLLLLVLAFIITYELAKIKVE